MTSWYGQSSTKQQIQALLEKKPKLAELFAINELAQELKSFNPKLLDYFSANSDLVREAITYITVAPSLTDSTDRKYKLPLLSVEMIETETACILNAFFKDNKEDTRGPFIDQFFFILNGVEILPLLAGYFFRVNLCLLNSRFKDAVERVYNSPAWFQKMLSHCEHMPITNVIQLYLNLDANKTVTSPSQSERINVKIETLGKIISKIANQARVKSPGSFAIIENLTGVLIETIQKYYLIADGKQMMEVITSQTCIDAMLGLLKESSELAYPAMNFFIVLINYYSFSSLNSEEKHNPDLAKKNLERLENQPMVVGINGYFVTAMERIMGSSRMTLHHYRILEVLCHMISLSSQKVLVTIRQVRFFQSLVELLFRFENSNVLHMLIEKAFLHIFISDRAIYDEYKKHLFCDMDVIQVTASRFLEMFPDEKSMQEARRKGYFGHFMRILKIYSGIQTTDEDIVAAIKSKGEVWNKISKMLIKPYETVCYKDLGSYTDVPEPTPLDFNIKKNIIEGLHPENSNAIEEVKREEEIQNIRTLESDISKEDSPSSPFTGPGDKFVDELFKNSSSDFLGQNTQPSDSTKNDAFQKIQQPEGPKQAEPRKSESFQEYMVKKKVEATNQIKLQRSQSTGRKLSGAKAKLTSPSPSKKNSWKEDNEKSLNTSITRFESSKNSDNDFKVAKTSIGSKKVLNQSTIVERTNHLMSQNNENSNERGGNRNSQSMVNLQDIKKIKVIQIDKPAEKKYRRMEEKDKLLLDFLGIAY